MTSSAARKIAAICTVAGLATIGTAVAPKPANAWWYNHGCCWGGFGVFVPPVVVAPPAPVYNPAPAYYAPAPRVWIPAHWQGNYWVPGHWS